MLHRETPVEMVIMEPQELLVQKDLLVTLALLDPEEMLYAFSSSCNHF